MVTLHRIAAGVMTGTSIDGIDVALVVAEGRGLALRARLLRHAHGDLGELAAPLRMVATGTPTTAAETARLARALGLRHAEALEAARAGDRVDLVCAHGQTIHHAPPLSVQLLDPAPIAVRLGCPVVLDLRQADLAAGGEGAPITPLADWILLRDEARRRAIVNLGGFCNMTILPAGDDPRSIEAIRGGDVCACSQVLDEVARRALGRPFDDGGAAAARGTVDPGARDDLAGMLRAKGRGDISPRSLGTGDEAFAWVERHLTDLDPDDLAATATAAVAGRIGAALAVQSVDQVVLAGGGTRHAALVGRLRGMVTVPLVTSDDLGLPSAAREAAAMAVLGLLCADGVPITLPQVTGCRAPAPVAGVWLLPAGVPLGPVLRTADATSP